MLPYGLPDEFYDWYIKNYIKEEKQKATIRCAVRLIFAVVFFVSLITLTLFLMGGALK